MTNFGNLSLFVAFLAIFSCVYNVSGKEVADKSNAGPQCVLCEFVMRELDQLISKNSTTEEIEAALKKVCSFLPTTIQAECKEYVDGYTAEILELLAQGLKPELVCSALGLCTPISDNQEPKLPAKVDAGNCALCEFIMKEIDSELTQNATEKEIVQLVENICTVLPSSLTAECDSFIETYGTVLINLLVQQLDPKEICTYLGQCSAATQVFKPKPAVGPVGANPEECALCEFIMKELDQLLSENATEEEIKMALDKVCSLLPKSLKTSCLVDVNKYTDIIIKLLLKGLDPSAICRAIQLCDNVAASNVAATADPDEDCVLCMDLMLALEDFLQSNRTEKEIYEDFVEACGGLGALANDCLTFVTKYGHEFPGLFDQLLAPLKVCEALKVCTCTTCKANENICSQGPTAWCKSMENAKLCNAVVHCQRHVWN